MSKQALENSPKTLEQKQEIIKNAAEKYGDFLNALQIDWRNLEHFHGTPLRVAKMHVNEIWSGLYDSEPDIRSFKNTGGYDGMVYSGGIDIKSSCAHHNQSFFGTCHIAYIPAKGGQIVGLSKLNRMAAFHSHQPTVQEDLTMKIWQHVDKACKGNLGCAVFISCTHLCCRNRGVNQDSVMKTSKMSGEFLNDKSLSREEFYHFVNDFKKSHV